jgi:hypothetical protein
VEGKTRFDSPAARTRQHAETKREHVVQRTQHAQSGSCLS